MSCDHHRFSRMIAHKLRELALRLLVWGRNRNSEVIPEIIRVAVRAAIREDVAIFLLMEPDVIRKIGQTVTRRRPGGRLLGCVDLLPAEHFDGEADALVAVI